MPSHKIIFLIKGIFSLKKFIYTGCQEQQQKVLKFKAK